MCLLVEKSNSSTMNSIISRTQYLMSCCGKFYRLLCPVRFCNSQNFPIRLLHLIYQYFQVSILVQISDIPSVNTNVALCRLLVLVVFFFFPSFFLVVPPFTLVHQLRLFELKVVLVLVPIWENRHTFQLCLEQQRHVAQASASPSEEMTG